MPTLLRPSAHQDWPFLPVLASTILILIGMVLSHRAAWLADLVALLLTFSIAKVFLIILLSKRRQCSPTLYWMGLCFLMTVAIASGLLIEKTLWPMLRIRHADWIMPSLLLVLLTATILPAAISAEISYKEHATLAKAQATHAVERQLLEARLAALQGQIEPHFLYNTLANARVLIRDDAVAAEAMLNHLNVYLRAAMPDLRANTTTLGQELERAKAYLDIMKIRLGERLQFTIDASEAARACAIPPLCVMTLVENAIEHGIEPQLRGGHLQINAVVDASILTITVSDDGAGFQAELGNGVGLINLQERLQTLYGQGDDESTETSAELSLAARLPSGVIATIRLPIQNELKV
ncbi:histidine kinase [Undibacterium sp. RTI2.1]|uniref:sensor histidine kinase n=1 Tax=unclassified Undibacterium TaxID=2630295 RepID=UPI002AB4F84D|nr:MULTISPECIES: histidine kinase [unclassified Undibacterium]MDY7536864.1 histidine kinase [Undibacterium sp. 5I1]MEB0029471.1 histidine kinase [Undibacterium sp. RTI2.1]MEB0115657.1 histidine kinase [Undibacterium sp. RTI2.2]MEB0230369.1 histidine kinase [Undibacterium sp. 10I3]MEB0256746.1 histidine kinase [Undibacterium sp. 5I1]